MKTPTEVGHDHYQKKDHHAALFYWESQNKNRLEILFGKTIPFLKHLKWKYYLLW